jgi:predicted ATPase/DNA-binding winged helix-turn-helix (wHTH) protein
VTTAGNEKRIVFDSFCLDLANERLWKGSTAIQIRPKVFTLLDYLLHRPGFLVTKEELIEAIWPGTFVDDSALKVVVRQLRKALGDDPKHPRFIETAHRRGYRFIGAIAAPTTPAQTGHPARLPSSLNAGPPPQTVVGREEALTRMRTCLDKMLGGERQVLFVTGEAGIGKTALVDAFVQSPVFDGTTRTARGQCLEQYGTSEAYLPFLEAIGRLCRVYPQIIDVLRTNAPMWLLQMPSLLSASDREVLSREMSGATHERMLREMAGALEALTADQPLVLILEDLHWSDYSTLDLISYLARQPQPAPLMLIGTYRTPELIARGHPLDAVKRELVAKQQCEELRLEDLSEEAVAKYLAVRFPGNLFPTKLATSIHQRTEGNPLFMINAVDYLVAEKLIDLREESFELVVDLENVKLGVPDSIKQMIEKQIDHLDVVEQRTLEVASVAGAEFSIAAVAAVLEEDGSEVEARCHKLTRQHQFIREGDVVEIPEGAALTRYTERAV